MSMVFLFTDLARRTLVLTQPQRRPIPAVICPLGLHVRVEGSILYLDDLVLDEGGSFFGAVFGAF